MQEILWNLDVKTLTNTSPKQETIFKVIRESLTK